MRWIYNKVYVIDNNTNFSNLTDYFVYHCISLKCIFLDMSILQDLIISCTGIMDLDTGDIYDLILVELDIQF